MPTVTDSEEIYVLGKKVRLLQPANEGFRTSLDSVMLAAACPVTGSAAAEGKAQRVLDMGCGVGGAAFCLLHRVPDCHVTGVDIEPAYIACAQKNVALNGREGHCEFVQADITAFNVENPAARFHHIICNPPYLEAGAHVPSPDRVKAGARGNLAQELTIREWVASALRLLKSGGSLTMIHRADAVDRIIRAMGGSFGAVEIIPLWPRQGVEAKRVIVRAVKDRKTPARLHAGLVLHDMDGSYTPQAEKILREGAALL